MKILTKINNKDNYNKYLNYCDGIIIGLKDYSVDYCEFSIDEIKQIKETTNKEIFVAINKNIFNSELDLLEKLLFELDNISVSGILFYDLSILYLKNKNNLKLDLVWNQTHMVTNYNTCNYYFDHGAMYAYLSGEITLDEIIEISENTKCKLFMQVVGHQVMSHSRRKLLSNYYSSINKEYDANTKEISEANNSLIVKEKNSGTTFKTKTVFNGIPYISKLTNSNISYLVVDEDFIESSVVIELLEIINNILLGQNVDENILKSKNLIGDNSSFLFKETIYKVKGDK